jgi:small subunit ribosomal protein S6
MAVYDMTVILSPQVEEGGFDTRIKDMVDLIGKSGGKVVRENRIGMRRMAYEIQKVTQGYYISLVFEGTGELVSELERRLRLDESCLRFLTCLYKDFSARAAVKGSALEGQDAQANAPRFDRLEREPEIHDDLADIDEKREELL